MLQDSGIQKDHVLWIVTDNVYNMLSIVKQFSEKPREISAKNSGRTTLA